MERTLTVNIDLDDIRYYRGIHALPAKEEKAEIFTAGVPRFLDLCESFGIRATLFVISADMEIEAARNAIADAAARGHEIASHTVSHDYGISKKTPAAIADELAGSRAALQEVCGAPVIGFRGPGYNLSPALLDALVETGYIYDTSIMSSPAYWAARAGIIAAMRLTGRKSSSITGRARDFFRGRAPFVWQGPGRGLREYPITTAGILTMPLIGTTIAGKGAMVRHMVDCAANLDFINIEFHGIDFLDQVSDGLEPELLVEPALKIPLSGRMDNFANVLERLGRNRKCPALCELAAQN